MGDKSSGNSGVVIMQAMFLMEPFTMYMQQYIGRIHAMCSKAAIALVYTRFKHFVADKNFRTFSIMLSFTKH